MNPSVKPLSVLHRSKTLKKKNNKVKEGEGLDYLATLSRWCPNGERSMSYERSVLSKGALGRKPESARPTRKEGTGL